MCTHMPPLPATHKPTCLTLLLRSCATPPPPPPQIQGRDWSSLHGVSDVRRAGWPNLPGHHTPRERGASETWSWSTGTCTGKACMSVALHGCGWDLCLIIAAFEACCNPGTCMVPRCPLPTLFVCMCELRTNNPPLCTHTERCALAPVCLPICLLLAFGRCLPSRLSVCLPACLSHTAHRCCLDRMSTLASS
jgi:hypothetical protein